MRILLLLVVLTVIGLALTRWLGEKPTTSHVPSEASNFAAALYRQPSHKADLSAALPANPATVSRPGNGKARLQQTADCLWR